MRKLALGLALLWGLATPAFAVDPSTSVGNVDYTILATDVKLIPSVALTANRTWTLPFAATSCIGQGGGAFSASCGASLEIVDNLGNVGGASSCVLLAPASGETINGSASSVTFCSTYGRVVIYPLTGSSWYAQVLGPGQYKGTATNDSAQAGFIGEVITSGVCAGTASTATVTITIAAPGVFTDTAHGITGACPVVFTNSGGGLPTGITSGTTYWISPSSVTTNTYSVSTTVANALAGTLITTTGTSTGTQTRTSGSTLSTGAATNVTGIAITAGDWDCRSTKSSVLGASTSVTIMSASLSQTSATMGTRGGNATNLLSSAANVMGVGGTDLGLGPARQSVASATNLYLVAQDTFTVSTNVAYGNITCRRVR